MAERARNMMLNFKRGAEPKRSLDIGILKGIVWLKFIAMGGARKCMASPAPGQIPRRLDDDEIYVVGVSSWNLSQVKYLDDHKIDPEWIRERIKYFTKELSNYNYIRRVVISYEGEDQIPISVERNKEIGKYFGVKYVQ